MKTFPVLALLAATLILFTTNSYSGDADKSKYSSLAELTGRRALSAKITGLGGHLGECVEISLANLSPDTSFVRLEPGRLLTSSDTLAQDILITREGLLALAPGEKRNIRVYGFCAEASMASPDSAGTFALGSMADSTIVVLAEFLDEKGNGYPEGAIQHAVWCLTDCHDVMGIYGDDTEDLAELRGLVASLQKIKYPGYSSAFPMEEVQPVQDYSVTISGEVEIFIPGDCLVDIYICDREGKIWETFEEKVPYKSGTFRYSFQISAINWPRGSYILQVRADGKVLYKKEFEI